jgi:membrane associated rhomboid family serine protease
LGSLVVKGWFPWVLAIGSFVAVAAFNVSAIWAIVLGAFLGILYAIFRQRREAKK